LIGQSESRDFLDTNVMGAADKGAPKSGLLKSMYGTDSTYKQMIKVHNYNNHTKFYKW